MAEDLQYLIDRIQQVAVDKADDQAAAIIANAKDKAAAIIKDAEAEAKAKLEKADQDALVYTERSNRTLEQASRDLLITLGKSFEKMILSILSLQTEENLTEDVMKQMLLNLSALYAKADSDVSVAFSEADTQKMTSFITGEFKAKLQSGVELKSDTGVHYGFRVKLDDGKVSHEFTSEAIAEALSALLRPQLAKVVSSVAGQGK
ncbi:MAG: ATPase [Fibrobacter sp.]|nr:ATPase [Fibrobacter sp.]